MKHSSMLPCFSLGLSAVLALFFTATADAWLERVRYVPQVPRLHYSSTLHYRNKVNALTATGRQWWFYETIANLQYPLGREVRHIRVPPSWRSFSRPCCYSEAFRRPHHVKLPTQPPSAANDLISRGGYEAGETTIQFSSPRDGKPRPKRRDPGKRTGRWISSKPKSATSGRSWPRDDLSFLPWLAATTPAIRQQAVHSIQAPFILPFPHPETIPHRQHPSRRRGAPPQKGSPTMMRAIQGSKEARGIESVSRALPPCCHPANVVAAATSHACLALLTRRLVRSTSRSPGMCLARLLQPPPPALRRCGLPASFHTSRRAPAMVRYPRYNAVLHQAGLETPDS